MAVDDLTRSRAEVLYTVDGGRIEALSLSSYPDGMPLVPFTSAPKTLLVRPKSVSTLMAALWWVDALVERGHQPPTLCLPCLPGARQDRLNDRGDYLFTAKSIAREINLRRFPRVRVVDPHSDVMPALFNRCDVVHAVDVIRNYVKHERWDAVISPDAGAEKRAGAVAKMLGLPLLRGWKTRDVSTGAIAGFGVQDSAGFNCVLVVDDLCDGGGTFIGLADELRDMTADLWTTHGLYNKGTSDLFRKFRYVYCTDSVDGPRDGVTEIPICESLLRGTL